MRKRIDDNAIQAAQNRAQRTGKKVYVWDRGLKGFGLYASPHGATSWLIQKWQDGKAKRTAFAQYPAVGIDEASEWARERIKQFNKGEDIFDWKAELRVQRLEKLRAAKLGEVATLYLDTKRNPGNYWPEVRRLFQNQIVPALGAETPIRAITKAELLALVDAKQASGRPGAARTLFAVLRPFLKWCASRDYIDSLLLENVEAPKPKKSRERILSDPEIVAFWRATQEDRLFGPFHRLLLLTAQRRDEVAGMQWREIREKIWTIPGSRTKNGETHIVHLSPQALAQLPTKRGNSEFVFTTTGDCCIAGHGKAKARLDKLMQPEEPWILHDLRRTAASGMAAQGILPDVADRVLNHISGSRGGVKGIYQRYEFLNERKRALEAWGNYVERLVYEKPLVDNVVSLVRA
jgi:integrase